MSNETVKNMGKNELIAKLSAVRDGLNTIAEEQRKIAHAEDEVKRLEALTEQRKREHEEAVRQATSKKNAVQLQVAAAEKKSEELYEERSNASWKSPGHYAKANKGLLIASIIVGVYFLGMMASVLSITASVEEAPSFLIALMFISMAAILPIITIKNRKKQGIIRRDEVIRAITAKIEDNQEKLDQLKIELTKATRDLKELSENAPTDEELQAFIKKVAEEINPQCMAKIAEAEKMIAENANGILEPEDWRNAGTLAYYLKTGRADSLKEALLMMVGQNQNEDLINAIRSAAGNITYAMHKMSGSMDSFGKQINTAYRETARKFDESYSDMQYAMADFSRSVSTQLGNLSSTIESQGSAITEAERRNADLLAHANQNSDELLYNIRYNS